MRQYWLLVLKSYVPLVTFLVYFCRLISIFSYLGTVIVRFLWAVLWNRFGGEASTVFARHYDIYKTHKKPINVSFLRFGSQRSFPLFLFFYFLRKWRQWYLYHIPINWCNVYVLRYPLTFTFLNYSIYVPHIWLQNSCDA